MREGHRERREGERGRYRKGEAAAVDHERALKNPTLWILKFPKDTGKIIRLGALSVRGCP